MKTWLLYPLISLSSGATALTLSPSALAGPPRPTEGREAPRDAFEAFLQSIDVVPPDRDALLATFPDAWTKLDAAARDESRNDWTRLRAISLLSYFPEARTRTTLEVVSRAKSVEVRRQAVYTLGRAFGATADASLLRFVASFARDPESAVREHAIRALRWVDAREAEAALTEIGRTGTAEERKLAVETLDKRKQRLASPRRGH